MPRADGVRASVPATAVVDGAQVRYWTYYPTPRLDGHSPVIVMVHGFRGTHQGLELIAGNLSEFQVVSPDLPGFGASPPMPGRKHDVAGYATVIAGLIRQLAVGPVVLLGHSFGSIVAARIAATEPSLVSSLILVNSLATPVPARGGPGRLGLRLASAYYRLAAAAPPRAGHVLLASKAFTLSMSAAMAVTRDRELRKDIHRRHLLHFSDFHNRQLLVEAFSEVGEAGVGDYAAGISMRTLLIAGERDRMAPPAGQRWLLPQLADGQLRTISGVGHLVHYEKPAAAAALIREFLASS
ncbi:alpha/beta hydrolase [Fodinicola feengrottensis]|uniref:alpha/beta fold hydrolase n=1 Tax=Fodinicola feengrottensis TaxID=435914 RepID=UPI0031CE9EDC